MAQMKNNWGLSGKIGDLVFRQRNGKTVVAKAPRKSEKERSPKQMQVTSAFQQAVIYAQAAIADPGTKKMYSAKAAKGKTAYNIAIADYFHAPDILDVNLSGYSGKSGQLIVIMVSDDFKVKAVKVTIHNQHGVLQEEGDAQQSENELEWRYVVKKKSKRGAVNKITVVASDMPGNLSSKEKVVE